METSASLLEIFFSSADGTVVFILGIILYTATIGPVLRQSTKPLIISLRILGLH